MPRPTIAFALALLLAMPAHASSTTRGFAVGDGVLFLVQPTEAAPIALFDEMGTWITSVGTDEPNRPDTIVSPVELLTDAAGDCYVLDQFGPSIAKISPTGEVLTRWGSRGFDPGQMRQPVDFGIDAKGNIDVLDLGREAVIRFSASGKFINEVLLDTEQTTDLVWSKAIGVGPDGDFVLVCDATTGDTGLLRHLRRYDSKGKRTSELTLAKIDGTGEIGDAAILPDGSLLFADAQSKPGASYTGAVYHFTQSGEFEKRWFISDPSTGRKYSPLRVKSRGDGIYVLTQTNLVCQIDDAGNVIKSWGAGELG